MDFDILASRHQSGSLVFLPLMLVYLRSFIRCPACAVSKGEHTTIQACFTQQQLLHYLCLYGTHTTRSASATVLQSTVQTTSCVLRKIHWSLRSQLPRRCFLNSAGTLGTIWKIPLSCLCFTNRTATRNLSGIRLRRDSNCLHQLH